MILSMISLEIRQKNFLQTEKKFIRERFFFAGFTLLQKDEMNSTTNYLGLYEHVSLFFSLLGDLSNINL